MDPLSQITAILFVGLIMGLLAKKIHVPSMLLLIVSGIIINNVTVLGEPVIEFTSNFLISSAILALVMIVFKDSSRFTLKDLDTYSEYAFKIAVVFLALNMVILSFATFALFRSGILLSLLFAAVMSGTDPGAVLTLFQSKSNNITEILKYESVINTPLIVLIPFILIDIMELGSDMTSGVVFNFVGSFSPFLQQIITGIGTGVFIGIIMFRFMKRFYSEKLSPLTLITSALLTYVLAESLGGNGVLAVTVLGIFFGNIRIKKKDELQDFYGMLTNVVEIIVFILIGFLIPLNLDPMFILKSLILFAIMIAVRYAAMEIVFLHDHVNLKERIFMALNCTKGIAVAVVAYLLSSDITRINHHILDLMVLFIIYSIVLASIAAKYSQHFIRLKIEG